MHTVMKHASGRQKTPSVSNNSKADSGHQSYDIQSQSKNSQWVSNDFRSCTVAAQDRFLYLGKISFVAVAASSII